MKRIRIKKNRNRETEGPGNPGKHRKLPQGLMKRSIDILSASEQLPFETNDEMPAERSSFSYTSKFLSEGMGYLIVCTGQRPTGAEQKHREDLKVQSTSGR